MMLPGMTATQSETASRMVRQAETAHMALNTAYRDPAYPGEELACLACGDSELFTMRPDGHLVCNDCGMTIGRWALRLDMAMRRDDHEAAVVGQPVA
jgi:hypothetical protein